jgi:hypothetical protein
MMGVVGQYTYLLVAISTMVLVALQITTLAITHLPSIGAECHRSRDSPSNSLGFPLRGRGCITGRLCDAPARASTAIANGAGTCCSILRDGSW